MEQQRYKQACPHKDNGIEARKRARCGVKEKSAHATEKSAVERRLTDSIAHGGISSTGKGLPVFTVEMNTYEKDIRSTCISCLMI